MICVSNYRDETVVLQDSRFAVTQALGDLPPFLAVQHHASEVGIYSMALVESQAILSHHVELPAKD